jgi:hypothetical protein
MGVFDTKRQRLIPDASRFAQSSQNEANTQQTDYLHPVAGLPAGGVNSNIIAFDLQYAVQGGTQRNAFAGIQAATLNLIPSILVGIGRQIEVTCRSDQAGQVEFLLADVEPNPLTLAQLLANSVPDVDRPPVAFSASLAQFKCLTYTCTSRYCIVQFRNTSAVLANWYGSVVARQP